jgi:hypothetical protein
MLELHFSGFQLTLELERRHVEKAGAPYLDWLHCIVRASTPGFEAQFPWSVMPTELAGLAEDLAAFQKAFPNGKEVSFEGTEPNVAVSFAPQSLGHIAGTYRLQSEIPGGAVLAGRFTLDQSYLPGLISSIRSFIAESIAAV